MKMNTKKPTTIEVPISWLEGLNKLAKIANDHFKGSPLPIIKLISYAQSVESLIPKDQDDD